jgi:hypothetical protein
MLNSHGDITVAAIVYTASFGGLSTYSYCSCFFAVWLWNSEQLLWHTWGEVRQMARLGLSIGMAVQVCCRVMLNEVAVQC